MTPRAGSHATSTRVVAAALTLILVGAACSSGSGSAAKEASATIPEPTRALRAVEHIVALPDAVHDAQLPWWTPDGRSIVMSARSSDFSGMQIVRVRPDGSDFACITCDVAPGDPPLMKPIPLDDRRILVRVGNQTPFSTSPHAVLECAPSVAQCTSAALLPIEIPTDDHVVQAQRELRAAPDGEHVGFTQVRRNTRGAETFVAVVARLVREGDHYLVDDPRVVSSRGELKDFTPDGHAVVISAFVEGPEAANGDDLLVDLRTGTTRRLTWYPDYEEPAERSPRDRALWAVGSARTAAIFEPFAAVRRPNLVGAAFSPLTFHLFLRLRDELLEPWVIDAAAERRGALGVPLDPGAGAQGWEGRMIPNWNRDGRRLVFWETRVESSPGTSDAGTRVVVATLRGTRPGPLPNDVRVAVGAWTPSLVGYEPVATPLPASRDGRIAGRVEVTATEDGDTVRIAIRYRGFSDRAGWVIDGTETVENTGGPTGSMRYAADLRLSGAHTGRMVAHDVAGNLDSFTGVVTSVVDGRRLRRDLATTG